MKHRKRVVALPGETVEIRGKKLYVNGEPVHEPYTDSVIEDGD
jgi:signal peptidase I